LFKILFSQGIFPNGYFQNVQLSGGNFLSLSKPQCSALHPCSNSSDRPPPLLQPAAPQKALPNRNEVAAWDITNLKLPLDKLLYYHKDLFTHKDINTYINGVKFLKIQVSKRKEKNMQNYAQIDNIDHYLLHNIFIISVIVTWEMTLGKMH